MYVDICVGGCGQYFFNGRKTGEDAGERHQNNSKVKENT